MAWSILGDEDLLPERQWQPPPFKRGTNQILVECFVTLLLCVWTAVHLNLQPKWKHDQKGIRKFTSKIPWKRCGYLVLGMIAPDLVTVVAIYQWRMTNQLWAEIQETELVDRKPLRQGRLKRLWRWATCSRIRAPGRNEDIEMASKEGPTQKSSPTVLSAQASNDVVAGGDPVQAEHVLGRDEEAQQDNISCNPGSSQQTGSPEMANDQTQHQAVVEEPPARRQHYWTKTHCWYAYIGGFVIQDLHGQPFPLPNGLTRMSLNTEAILHFAQTHPQVFPDISEGAIEDKSKADMLAKLIICGQALWFCANLFGRVFTHLPLTALELNTSAHCLCTLLTYIFWWNKPYNVSDGTALLLDDENDETASEAAYMCLRSWDGRNILCEGADLEYGPWGLSWIAPFLGSQYLELGEQHWAETHHISHDAVDIETSRERRTDLTGETLNSFPAMFRGTIRWWFHGSFPFTSWLKEGSADREGKMSVPYAGETRRLINLAMKYISRRDHCILITDSDAGPRGWRSTPEFSWSFYFGTDDGNLVWVDHVVQGMLLLACMLYGGIHLLAFNGPFPSMIHRSGWYCGAFAFVPFIFWLMFSFICFSIVEFIKSYISDIDEQKWTMWENELLGGALVLLGLVVQAMFFLFRGFLTYEPYAALGFAPAGAYEVPDWSAYFIHIS